MPLSKVRNRERMRLLRHHTSVQPMRADLQELIHTIERGEHPICATPVQPIVDNIPWYNPEIHTTGDKVKQFRNCHVEVVTL